MDARGRYQQLISRRVIIKFLITLENLISPLFKIIIIKVKKKQLESQLVNLAISSRLIFILLKQLRSNFIPVINNNGGS